MFSLDFLYALIWYGYLIGFLFFAVSVYFLLRFQAKRGVAIFCLFAGYVLFGLAVITTAYGYYQHVEYFGFLVLDLSPIFYVASQASRLFYFEELTGILLQYFVSYTSRLFFKWNITFMLVAIADFFIFAFTEEAFIQKRKYLIPFAVVTISLVGFFFVFWDPLINWAAVMILSLATYAILGYFSYRAMQLAENKSYRYGFAMILSSNILLSLFFVFMSVDRLIGRWTPFLFLAWTILFLASILAFVGYTTPPWFKKIFKET